VWRAPRGMLFVGGGRVLVRAVRGGVSALSAHPPMVGWSRASSESEVETGLSSHRGCSSSQARISCWKMTDFVTAPASAAAKAVDAVSTSPWMASLSRSLGEHGRAVDAGDRLLRRRTQRSELWVADGDLAPPWVRVEGGDSWGDEELVMGPVRVSTRRRWAGRDLGRCCLARLGAIWAGISRPIWFWCAAQTPRRACTGSPISTLNILGFRLLVNHVTCSSAPLLPPCIQSTAGGGGDTGSPVRRLPI
jgi:hypothetical protein